MEDLTETTKSFKKLNFFEHVCNFDDPTKAELLNIVQYSTLSIIPVVILNKFVKRYIPEVDEFKGSLEILVEVLAQVFVMFIGIFYIHRLVTFLPTYSGVNYEQQVLTTVIIGTLLIVLSLQTKLGEKTNILIDRLHDLWTGESSLSEDKEKQGKQQQQQQEPAQNNHFPTTEKLTLKNEPNNVNYSAMHQSNPNPMINANSPQNYYPEQNEVMAANEAIGGGFGSMF